MPLPCSTGACRTGKSFAASATRVMLMAPRRVAAEWLLAGAWTFGDRDTGAAGEGQSSNTSSCVAAEA